MKKIRRAWYCKECKEINLIKSDGSMPFFCGCVKYTPYSDCITEMRRIQKSWVPLWEIRGDE